MPENKQDFEDGEEFSEEYEEKDLSSEEAREEALDNDEIDAEEDGFLEGFNSEEDFLEIEIEE